MRLVERLCLPDLSLPDTIHLASEHPDNGKMARPFPKKKRNSCEAGPGDGSPGVVVEPRPRKTRKSANPFVRAALEEAAMHELHSDSSAEEDADDYSDLDDFIVCNPDTDYRRFLEKFRARCRQEIG
eukprot:scaffold122220_cov32-Prasinocladus_malaysianus.AAC.1